MTPLQKFMQDLLGMIDLISKDKDTVSPIEKARILNASLNLGKDLSDVGKFICLQNQGASIHAGGCDVQALHSEAR